MNQAIYHEYTIRGRKVLKNVYHQKKFVSLFTCHCVHGHMVTFSYARHIKHKYRWYTVYFYKRGIFLQLTTPIRKLLKHKSKYTTIAVYFMVYAVDNTTYFRYYTIDMILLA